MMVVVAYVAHVLEGMVAGTASLAALVQTRCGRGGVRALSRMFLAEPVKGCS